MARRFVSLALFAFSALPFALFLNQDPQQAQQELKCEDVYTNIKVFKGVPASDLIPAMEFMSASMKWECKDCHDPNDYAAETHAKETARQMVLLQRDINEQFFNGRLEVTCMTCHNGQEHPDNLPLPGDVTIRHGRVSNAPKSPELFAKHTAVAGAAPVVLTRTGTMTAPNDLTHEIETKPAELVQAEGGRFKLVSGDRVVVCDGAKVTYGGIEMWGEPTAFFQRLGRTWWGAGAFEGLEGMAVSGRDSINGDSVLVVRANRSSTASQEELYFDEETGRLRRLVNMKRSSLGTVVTVYDYENFSMLDGTSVPMRLTVTFAGGQRWIFDFSSAKKGTTVAPDLFKIGL